MAKNNDVFSIIPILSDSAIMAAGSPKSALALNQVGIFDYETGLSINAGSAATTRNFFIAMAVDRDGDGNVDDYVEIAGTHIQKKNVLSYNARCYTPGQNQIVDIQNFTVNCNETYAIKVQLDNDEKYANYGFNQAAKTFSIKSKCCSSCAGCGDGDCVSLVSEFVTLINNDTDNLIVASAFANVAVLTVNTGAITADGNVTITIDGVGIVVAVLNGDTAAQVATKIATAVSATSGYSAFAIGANVYVGSTSGAFLDAALVVAFVDTGTTGVTMTVADIESTTITNFTTFATQYPGVCPTLRLTSNPSAVNKYCCLNTKYHHLRNPHLTVSFVRGNTHAIGFECNGEIVTYQDLVYPEGAGYDMAQLEYLSLGHKGSPYRVNNLSEGDNLPEALVSKTGTYNKIDLTYELESKSGWLDYKNNLNTTILIPCEYATFTPSFLAVLDALLTEFDAKANDLAACDCNLNLTEDKAANVDGLG